MHAPSVALELVAVDLDPLSQQQLPPVHSISLWQTFAIIHFIIIELAFN
jgi:hypothetical protein